MPKVLIHHMVETTQNRIGEEQSFFRKNENHSSQMFAVGHVFGKINEKKMWLF